jgi:hypothetical protein
VEFSSKKKVHFRHDKLTRGICVNTCKKLIAEMGLAADDFFVPEFELDYKVKKKLMNHKSFILKPVFLQINFDFIGFANSTEDRAYFNKIINQCINVDLMKLHNLKGFSSIEYCTQKENITKIGELNNSRFSKSLDVMYFFTDALDIFFIVALSILLAVIYMSSAFDEKTRIRNLKSTKIQTEPEDHYKKEPNVLCKKTKRDSELELDNRSANMCCLFFSSSA